MFKDFTPSNMSRPALPQCTLNPYESYKWYPSASSTRNLPTTGASEQDIAYVTGKLIRYAYERVVDGLYSYWSPPIPAREKRKEKIRQHVLANFNQRLQAATYQTKHNPYDISKLDILNNIIKDFFESPVFDANEKEDINQQINTNVIKKLDEIQQFYLWMEHEELINKNSHLNYGSLEAIFTAKNMNYAHINFVLKHHGGNLKIKVVPPDELLIPNRDAAQMGIAYQGNKFSSMVLFLPETLRSSTSEEFKQLVVHEMRHVAWAMARIQLNPEALLSYSKEDIELFLCSPYYPVQSSEEKVFNALFEKGLREFNKFEVLLNKEFKLKKNSEEYKELQAYKKIAQTLPVDHMTFPFPMDFYLKHLRHLKPGKTYNLDQIFGIAFGKVEVEKIQELHSEQYAYAITIKFLDKNRAMLAHIEFMEINLAEYPPALHTKEKDAYLCQYFSPEIIRHFFRELKAYQDKIFKAAEEKFEAMEREKSLLEEDNDEENNLEKRFSF